MLFWHKIMDDGCEIAVWKIEESVDEILTLFSKKQAKKYAKEIERFQFPKRKLEFLISRLLLNIITNSEKTVTYNKSGRPFLTDDSREISISHTQNYVAVAAHTSLRVGIDIEVRRDKAARLKNKFMSQSELDSIVDDAQEHILLHWSAKETMFKLMDEQSVDFIDHLHILPFSCDFDGGEFFCHETRTEQEQSFNLKFLMFDDFVMVWGTSCLS